MAELRGDSGRQRREGVDGRLGANPKVDKLPCKETGRWDSCWKENHDSTKSNIEGPWFTSGRLVLCGGVRRNIAGRRRRSI
jgi:hypothetical protein